VLQPTSTASSAEAERKRALLLDAAEVEAVVARDAATVRWLICGRGRPVSTAGADADYMVALVADRAFVLFADIEASRVSAEERFEELGFESVAFPWFEGPDDALQDILGGRRAVDGRAVDEIAAPLRRNLDGNEVRRYRAAGADAAEALVETVAALAPDTRESDAAAELGGRLLRRGFSAPVILVAGNERQRVHRHPLPTDAHLGRHALLALTAERHGLHVSMTRLISFGRAPRQLVTLAATTAAVDAAMLLASQPGATLGDVFGVAVGAYSTHGFPGEWRHHHQGGLTGYLGREVFAVPGDVTPMPASCAVAWNPSITGGAKSEDTALVTHDGIEILTRTPDLPEIEVDGLARPAIVEV
jgi:Xaa-Pro aminopeptidase